MQDHNNQPLSPQSFFEMVRPKKTTPASQTAPDDSAQAEANQTEPTDIHSRTQNRTHQSAHIQAEIAIQQHTDQAAQTQSECSTLAITGQMPHEARRVLIHLMKNGTVLATENNKRFDLLCRYQTQIRQFLADIYLKLILDEKQGVGYIINVDSATDDNYPDNNHPDQNVDDLPSLIRKHTLTLYDTLVLLILRKYYQDRERTGEQRIMIDAERIQVQLTPFIPLTNHDRKDRKKLNGSLDKFVEKKILTVARGEEDRYLITPIIRYVVNAQVLESLLLEYSQLAQHNKDGLSEQQTGEK